jgi:hypothetical protein
MKPPSTLEKLALALAPKGKKWRQTWRQKEMMIDEKSSIIRSHHT